MTLKQKHWLCIAIMMAGVLLSILANHARNNAVAVQILVALAGLCMLGGLLLHVKLVRCPHCGEWVGKYPGEYCKDCGKELNWDQK